MARIHDHTNRKDVKILAGMITSGPVLGKISQVWTDKGLFASPFANEIGHWCVKHYRRHGKPPGILIRDYFEDLCRDRKDRGTSDAVEQLLRFVSDDYEQEAAAINPEHLIDIANVHFDSVRLEETIRLAQAHLSAGDVAKAQELVTGYAKIPLNATEGIDVLSDTAAMHAAFERQSQAIVRYEGALGEFFGNELDRENFVAFLAPEKTGKTFWLEDVAWHALLQRRKVAFFQIGDLSERQMLRRFYARAAQHPYRSTNEDGSWPCTVRFPIQLRTVQGNPLALVDHEQITFNEPLNEAKAKEACDRIIRQDIRSRRSYLKLFIHPAKTLTVKGIHSILQTWQLRDWEPDCVCVDYADILADPYGRMDKRDAINANWEELRKLSEQWKCLVVTATQADADSYNQTLLNRRNFSEDKRKNAHATGIIGINMTAEEKDAGIQRLNWIVKREGEYSFRRVVHVATCLPYAQASVLSTW